MPLTDTNIRAAKAGQKIKKLSDGGGLQLWIFPNGAKRWRLAYRKDGKQKLLALGVYPEVTLRVALPRAGAAREHLSPSTSPVDTQRQDRRARAIAAANTFDAISFEWLEKKRREGRADSTLKKAEWLFSLVRLKIGKRAIADLTPAGILEAVRPIEAKGNHETAHKTLARIGAVCRYAVATARLDSDPTRDLRGALTAPNVKHQAAITSPDEFGALLRAIESYSGAAATRIALELLALTFVRPGELRHATWKEFDFDKSVWLIPPGRMKMRRPHTVPLSRQAIKHLTTLKELSGQDILLFPSERSKQRPMSENTLNGALRRLGFTSDEMTSHGFRASASTLLNECGLFSADAIERQLAHADEDAVRGVYSRGAYWSERVKLMQFWADECDRLRLSEAPKPLALRNAS